MLGLQCPPRVHKHHSQHRHQDQSPQAPQTQLQRLQDAKRRAIISLSRQHQAPGPTPLSKVWSADEDMTDEGPSPQSSPCPPSLVNDGEGRSLFHRISFSKPPSTDSKANRDGYCHQPGRKDGQNHSAMRHFSPAAKDSTKSPSLFPEIRVVDAKVANILSPTPSAGLVRTDSDMKECVPSSAASPSPTSWLAKTQTRQEPINMEIRSESKPTLLNFSLSNNIKAPLNPASLAAFQPLASVVWKIPTTPSFVKPSRASLPLLTTSTSSPISMAAWSSPDVRMTTPAPTSHPGFSFLNSTNQLQQQYSHFKFSSPFEAMAPSHNMSPSSLHHLHIAPTAALNFKPPHPPKPSPPLAAASSSPQLSTSVYLACLAKQEGDNGRDVKVMLKCKMMACLQREAVIFERAGLRIETVDRYRRGFGCGGCGEMLEVVVC